VVRLLDLLAGLSRLADLGFGLPSGEALRSAALAGALARSLELSEDDTRAALHTALLHRLGCIGYAHETARLSGNELAWSAASEYANIADPRDVLRTFLPAVMRGRPPLEQARLAFVTITRGRGFAIDYATAACEVGRDAARRLRVGQEVGRSIFHSYEWWNGKGVPAGLAGEDIPMGARVALVTSTASLFDATGGADLAAAALRERAGGMLDPHLAEHVAARAHVLLGEVGAGDPRDLVLDAEPRPLATITGPRLIDVAAVFGDLADLKCPYTHGHSRGVAALARGAGERLGLSAAVVEGLEVAGLLHDVGRVAISAAIWEKPGSLTAHEWEQIRLHAYHSERILAGSQHLARLAPLVGTHHERLDATGYHRACSGSELGVPARVLASADAYQAMTQRRPHRPPLAPEQAERCLHGDAREGRLDPDAVEAVLAVAGRQATVPRREAPAGLTAREVEVLALVAEGRTNAQIAERLVISRRTAEHHVQHIYTKIGASSRAAAALFAMEHDLLDAGWAREDR
jgi:HD-GYP domain-containing protein (c-di-GMP phosphodiesterase class II)